MATKTCEDFEYNGKIRLNEAESAADCSSEAPLAAITGVIPAVTGSARRQWSMAQCFHDKKSDFYKLRLSSPLRNGI